MSPTEQLKEIERRLKLLEAEAAALSEGSTYWNGVFAGYSTALDTIREVRES